MHEMDAKYGPNLVNLLDRNGKFNHNLASLHRLGATICPFGSRFPSACFDTQAANTWLCGFVFAL